MAANASVGMETPVLASVAAESQVYADLNTVRGTTLGWRHLASGRAGE